MVRGELTAFLSLIFLLLLSFVGAVLESASIQVLKNEKRADAGRAAESVFAEYHRMLLEQYEIFSVEGSYESGTMSEENILNRLSYYGAENMELTVEAIRYLTDQNGQEFYWQAVEFEKEKTGASVVEDIVGKLPVLEKQEQEAKECQKENTKTSIELEQMLQENEQELPQEGNPLETVSEIQAEGLLKCVLPKEFSLSQKRIDITQTVSHRSLAEGYGDLEQKADGAGDAIFFNLYLMDYFGNATEVKDETALQYELEYLLEGNATDAENLEAVAKKICGLRFAVNYAYLLTDTEKQAEAAAMAGTLCVLLNVPGLTELVKQAILLAWAYGEGVMDVRSLLAGNRVPLMKSKESWQLSLEGVLNIGEDTESEGMDVEGGIAYDKYLQALLLLEKKETVSMRALDLIEENMKSVHGQEFFRADTCVTGMKVNVVCSMRRAVRFKFDTVFQYQ